MARKIKYGKMVIVIFLTVLIWVWADLQLEQRLSVPDITITIAKSTDASLWVSFGDEGESSILIDTVELKGPASRIAEADRMFERGLLDRGYFLDPKQEVMTEPGNHSLNVTNFIKHTKQIQDLGLTVESCEPETVSVRVIKLVKKSLTVICFDESNVPIQSENINPPKVDVFVPDDWAGEKLTAKVQMTQREISQARSGPIEKTPYIELPGGQTRAALTAVKIKMPPAEDVLKDFVLTPTLGIALSPNLQPKYKVKITNLTEVISPITIRATAQAKQAYEAQPYPLMTLYILDDDIKKQGVQRREIVFNLPREFVQKGEIIPPEVPPQAQFILEPLSAEATEGTSE